MSKRISDATIRKISQLSSDRQVRAKRVVTRHVRACRKAGLDLEDPERTFLEAIELVEKDMDKEEAGDRDHEPARQYDAYISPRVP